MDKWRGKLKGKIVLASEERALHQVTEPLSERWTADELAKEELFPQPHPRAEKAGAIPGSMANAEPRTNSGNAQKD